MVLLTVSNPAAPNLPLAPTEYQRQYGDQLNNVLRLYFNQLNQSLGQTITNTITLQDEINALGLAAQRNQTLIWLNM